MITDNNMLMSLALLERVPALLKTDKREQLSRSNLSAIKQFIDQTISKLNSSGISDVFILGSLVDISENIEVLVEDKEYIETDSETKDIFTNKLMEALDGLYLVVGKYYMNKQFDYSIRLQPLLVRIVDKCIAKGFYFGEEV